MKLIGLGNANATLSVYIENTPPIEQYQTLSICRPMQSNEIASIARETGNHWRKIFNVYAKIIFELTSTKYKDWQTFREEELLQIHSQQNSSLYQPQSQWSAIGKFQQSPISLHRFCP